MHEKQVFLSGLKRTGRCYVLTSEKVGKKNFENAASNREYWYSLWRFDTISTRRVDTIFFKYRYENSRVQLASDT